MGLTLSSPLAMFHTFKATRECLRICDSAFGKSHHLHNRANAVRHALWNLLILKRIAKKEDNSNRALKWTEKITSWHEEFAVNLELEKAMDLHNNKIGRNLFVTLRGKSATDMLKHLQSLALNALQITAVDDIATQESRLVYITE